MLSIVLFCILGIFIVHGCLYGYSLYINNRHQYDISFKNVIMASLCSIQATFGTLIIYLLFILRHLTHILNNYYIKNTYHTGLPKSTPLLFVHPALHNSGAWLIYLYYYIKHGYRNFYFFEYSCRESSLQSAGERLAGKIDCIIEKHKDEGLIIIGASLGALVARASLTRITYPELVKGFITLACPHSGTHLASAVPSIIFPLLHDIAYQGVGIQALEKSEKECQGAHFPRIAFASDMDEMVVPGCSLLPPKFTNQDWKMYHIASISHMNIMIHIPTIRRTLHEVAKLRIT